MALLHLCTTSLRGDMFTACVRTCNWSNTRGYHVTVPPLVSTAFLLFFTLPSISTLGVYSHLLPSTATYSIILVRTFQNLPEKKYFELKKLVALLPPHSNYLGVFLRFRRGFAEVITLYGVSTHEFQPNVKLWAVEIGHLFL